MKLKKNFFIAALFFIVLPVVIVSAKYAEYAESRFFGAGGVGYAFDYGKTKYSRVLEVLYSPAKALVQPVVNRLQVGGLIVELFADLLSIGIQNLALLLTFFAWRAHRPRSDKLLV